ncbi:unnamed protein product [Brassica oleracea var. botrytis]
MESFTERSANTNHQTQLCFSSETSVDKFCCYFLRLEEGSFICARLGTYEHTFSL